MVGNWLRNFDFANQVFNDLLEQDDFLQVYVVTNEVNFSYFQKHDRLFLETNITDWKLRDLYRRSYLVFCLYIRIRLIMLLWRLLLPVVKL